MVSKLKKPATEWEKIFTSYTSDKGLIIRIYREIKTLNSSQIIELIKYCAIELNRTFSIEEVQMAKKITLVHKRNTNQNHTKIPLHSC
jgi:hypothetical protein